MVRQQQVHWQMEPIILLLQKRKIRHQLKKQLLSQMVRVRQ